MECRKVKWRANRNKNWAKSTKYASCTSSQQYFISPFRSYLLEVHGHIKINKCKRILEKMSVRLIWSVELVKCEATCRNNWVKWTKYANCTSSRQYFPMPPKVLPPRRTRRQKFHLGDLLKKKLKIDEGEGNSHTRFSETFLI